MSRKVPAKKLEPGKAKGLAKPYEPTAAEPTIRPPPNLKHGGRRGFRLFPLPNFPRRSSGAFLYGLGIKALLSAGLLSSTVGDI
jgi:hypothetical protein